jgi:pyridoxine 5-phosphate synthase
MTIRLGVNIDHVATVRNARGGEYPDPIRAALIAAAAGADGITAHLREDRRHIRDDDITRLKNDINLPLNLEMAATDEMLQIAIKTKPNACCLVPEKRAELTTEGGLDVIKYSSSLKPYILKLKDAGIKVSLFIDPSEAQIAKSSELGADIVELHTGIYAEYEGEKQKIELQRLVDAAKLANEYKLECHAGHGLNYENVVQIARISEIKELNIGHFLIAEAIFIGLDEAIKKMKMLMSS